MSKKKKSITELLSLLRKRGYTDFYLSKEYDKNWWFKAIKETCESTEAIKSTIYKAILGSVKNDTWKGKRF